MHCFYVILKDQELKMLQLVSSGDILSEWGFTKILNEAKNHDQSVMIFEKKCFKSNVIKKKQFNVLSVVRFPDRL